MRIQLTEDNKIARAAAGLAISNFGFPVPTDIAQRPESWAPTSYAEVCSLGGHLMEDDQHERIFRQEAEMWEKNIRDAGGIRQYAEKSTWNPWLMQIAEAF